MYSISSLPASIARCVFLTPVVTNLKNAFFDGSPASLAGNPNVSIKLNTAPLVPLILPVRSTSTGLPFLSNLNPVLSALSKVFSKSL